MPRRAKRGANLGIKQPNKKIKCTRNRSNKEKSNLVLPCLNKNPTNAGEKDPPSDLSNEDSEDLFLPDMDLSEESTKVCKMHQKISAVAYLFENKYKGLDEQVLQDS